MPTPMQRTGSNPVKVNTDTRSAVDVLRLQRMARELRLTDQILSLDVDSVSLVEGVGNAPAWTSADGASITLDVSKMPGLLRRRGIAVWLGTNAHELFHNLYTPRSEALLMRRVQAAERSSDPGIHRSWNVLEDQRIERLGLARYAAWRGYLIAALSHHIPVAHPEAWVLVAGRTWLPDEVRAIARAAFVATNGDADARVAAELIGAYQRLSDPGEADNLEAWDIVNEFHGLFGQSIPPRGSCGSAGSIQEGEPEPGDDESCSYPTADEADNDDDDDDESDEGDESGSDDDDGDDEGDDEGDGSDDDATADEDDGDDEADEDGDGDGDEGDAESDEDDGSDSDDDDDGDGEGDDDGDSDDEGDGGDGESDEADADDDFDPGDGTSGPDGTRSMTEALDDAIDEALDDDDTAADLDRVVDNLAHGPSGGGVLPRTVGTWIDATAEARLLARDVTAILSDIRDDNEASWIRRTDSGRFSVDRWATDPDWDADNVFDLFAPGAMDASSLDVVLVLDVSGSMSAENKRLAEATWAIRQAVDRVEGTVTCLAFGDDASLMFDAGQRPDGRMFLPYLESSTDPVNAIRDAHRIVAESTATNRIVIVLTDGQWWNAAPATRALVAAGAEGAITCVVGLGSEGRHIKAGFAGAQYGAAIKEAGELVPIFRELAEGSMRAAAQR